MYLLLLLFESDNFLYTKISVPLFVLLFVVAQVQYFVGQFFLYFVDKGECHPHTRVVFLGS